jgi:hypothetical protein
MKHFSTQNWVDFARGAADSALVTTIQRHLGESCSECLQSAETWRRVMETTKKLAHLDPPEASLQAVKAGFGLRKVIPFPSGKLDLAVLQFDSEREPLVAGVRSGHGSARQLLYKSGSVCIDMRMQPTPGSESIILIGQLLDSLNPGHGISGIPVSLLSKGDTVSRKETNNAGEFDFGLNLQRELQLVFGIGESRTIVVSVPDGMSSGHRLM